LSAKAELHCHLGGLLCPAYLKSAQADGHCPDLSLSGLQGLYPVESLSDWSVLMEYLDPHEDRNPALFLHVLASHLNALALQNVQYAEIMLESFLMIEFDELVEWLKKYRALADREDIEVSFLWCVGRTPDKDLFASKAERITKLFELGLLDGFAVAADESACRIEDQADTFDALKAANVPVEIHAGEWLGPESVWDALEYGHTRRIGHGLSVFDDPTLVQHVLEHDIHIEFCPTSNLKLTHIERIERHPIFKAIDLDMNFSINTDDPGHFECSMTSEIELVGSVRPLNVEKVFENTMRSAFRVM
jgi:adenosine deaminase